MFVLISVVVFKMIILINSKLSLLFDYKKKLRFTIILLFACKPVQKDLIAVRLKTFLPPEE